MILKEAIRAGESGGRKAAVREELLPSQHPLTKPTRDISASNRSHSITRQDPPPTFLSDKRLRLLQRQAEEIEYQKQANIVYTRQFRALAKLLGNQTMEFDQLKDKIETLVLKEIPNHNDPALYQRIQNLERELTKRNISPQIIGRSMQSLPTSNQYLRGLENQLGRKSKMINELSDSIKRETFQQVFRNLQAEISLKTNELKHLQEQVQQSRVKANNNLSMLEEELVKQKQTIQKLTFELDTQKRKSQNLADDVERLKRREKELVNNLQSESKASYQGVTYSTHALLMQLSARDQQLSSAINEQNYIQQQLYNAKQQQLRSQDVLNKTEEEYRQIKKKLQSSSSQNQKLLEEIAQVTRQLRNSNQVVASASANQQSLLVEKQQLQQHLQQILIKLKQVETSNFQLRQERNNCITKISQLQSVVNNLSIHVGQGRNQVQSKQRQIEETNNEIHRLTSQLNDKIKMINRQEETFKLKDHQFLDLKEYIAQRQEQFTHEMDSKSRQFLIQMDSLKLTLNTQNQQSLLRISQLQANNSLLTSELHNYQIKFSQRSRQIIQKKEQLNVFEQRIQAFQQEKYTLLQRLDQHQKQYEQLAHKYTQSQQAIREKYSLQAQITTRLQQENQLRNLLDQAANKQAQMELELHQQEMHLADIQEERKKQTAVYEQQISNLKKMVEELQEQKEHERHNVEVRLEEEYKIRDQLQSQINTVRQAINSLEAKHKDQLLIQLQALNKAQQLSHELHQQYEYQRREKQQLLHQNQQVREEHQKMRITLNEQIEEINQLNEAIHTTQTKYKKAITQYQQSNHRLQNQMHQLSLVIQEMKAEKAQIEVQLQMAKKSRQNQLTSFSFNHFQREQQESPTKLKNIIQDLEQRLQTYQRQQEQRIRLSYSRTLQTSPQVMIGSLQSEKDLLQNEKNMLEQQLYDYQNNLTLKQNEINELHSHLHQLNQELLQHKQLLRQKEDQVISIKHDADQQNNILIHEKNILEYQLNQQIHNLQQTILAKQQEFVALQHKYGQQLHQLESITNQKQSQSYNHQQLLDQKENQYQLFKQKSNKQLLYLQEKLDLRQKQFLVMERQYDAQVQSMARQQDYINNINLELSRFKQANDIKIVKMQLQQYKLQLQKSAQQQARLRQQIQTNIEESEGLKQEILSLKEKSAQYEAKIRQMEHKIHELELHAHQPSRVQQFIQPNKIQSHLSKRSYVSHQENHSKSASSQLSRRILNDPSKISGQQSKFAHNILVFQNSKINIVRQIPNNQIKTEQRQIKEQRQEESVLSKQIQNKTPESSHKYISNNHFDRLSNDNSKKDMRESQQIINESINSSRKSNHFKEPAQRSHTNSLKSIHQAEEVQQVSIPPANNSSIQSINSKEREGRPKQYLPQQSSKKAISNPNQSKQNVSIDESQRNSFHKAQQTKIPIYIARASALQLIPQERREASESRSGSKTKVRISYGQASEPSMQFKRRQVPKPLQGSQASKASKQSIKVPVDNSMNEVSPVNPRNSNVQAQTPAASLFSSQRRQNLQSRQSTVNNHNEGVDHPSQSIINGINQLASRLQTFTNPIRTSNVQVPKNETIVRRETSPAFMQPRIATVYSPRHSNANFNSVRNTTLVPSAFRHNEIVNTNERRQLKKQELTVPPSKIIMRSVIGGKRNSLLNETATFGKNSKQGEQQAYSQSNDSGIDILQMDWMAPCCKNE